MGFSQHECIAEISAGNGCDAIKPTRTKIPVGDFWHLFWLLPSPAPQTSLEAEIYPTHIYLCAVVFLFPLLFEFISEGVKDGHSNHRERIINQTPTTVFNFSSACWCDSRIVLKANTGMIIANLQSGEKKSNLLTGKKRNIEITLLCGF